MSEKPSIVDTYDNLTYGKSELQDVMQRTYAKIIDFVTSDSFKKLMLEMSNLSHAERAKFVHEVILNDAALNLRGINVPKGILIQRSAFGDRRPTLFAVKHFLPIEYSNVWENVNITFDNEYLDEDVSRDRIIAWREPLLPSIQANAMVQDLKLECV